VRLRALSETECYTRCYGGRRGERVTVVKVVTREERREADALRRIAERKQAA